MEPKESFQQRLGELRQEIDSWRKSRICLGHVPTPIWEAAAELAKIGGINPVAAPLGLNYYRLKRRVLGSQPSAKPASEAIEFVELQVNPAAHALECTVELVDRQGTTLRVRLVGGGTAEAFALVRSFWQGQR